MADETPAPAAEPAATSTPAPAADPGQTPAPQPAPAAPAQAEWRASLPDDLRPHAERFESVEGVLRGNLELRAERDRLRSTAIVPPGDKAKPEEIAAYREKIGVPKEPDGYAPVFAAPEGRAFTEAEQAGNAEWMKRFHEHDIPLPKAKALVEAFQADIARGQEQIKAEDKKFVEDSDRQLKAQWGADYAANREVSNRAVQAFADRAGVDIEELRHMETGDGRFLLDDPRILRLFAAAGREMQEGNLGPAMNEAQRNDAQSQLRAVREGIQKARANRDSAEANRLYQEEQRIIERMQGSRPIVGAAGRAA